MKTSDQEREVKFYILQPELLTERLHELDAELVRQRTHEYNLRFDTPIKSLSRNHQLLRLRKNHSAFLTYKGRSRLSGGVFSRQEIEFEVGDFEAARRLVEALGFRVLVAYEKYRTTYRLDSLEIVIDELPYGDFVEIEGSSDQEIKVFANKLNLDWERAVQTNYLGLFRLLKKRSGYRFDDLVFKNFSGLKITAEDLGLLPADAG